MDENVGDDMDDDVNDDVDMGLFARKPVFKVSDKARLKPVSSATETSS